MSHQTNYYKLGLFVLAGFAAILAGLLIFGVGAMHRETIKIETYLDESVQGLEVGSPLKHRGVHVGNVAEITFVRSMYERQIDVEESLQYGQWVVVVIDVFPDLLGGPEPVNLQRYAELLIKEKGLRVKLAQQGVTGLAYLEIDYVDPERYPPLDVPWQPENLYIPSIRSTLARLTGAVQQIVLDLQEAEIDQIGQNLNSVLQHADRSLSNITSSTTDATSLVAELRETNRRVQALLGAAELKTMLSSGAGTARKAEAAVDKLSSEFEVILADLRVASANARALSEELDGVGPDLSTAAQNAREASEPLPQAGEDLAQTVQRIERLVAAQQHSIELILENLRQFSEDLRDAGTTVRDYPSQILFGDPPPRRERPQP